MLDRYVIRNDPFSVYRPDNKRTILLMVITLLILLVLLIIYYIYQIDQQHKDHFINPFI